MAVQGNRGFRNKRPKRGLIQFTEWKQEAINQLIQDDELTKLLAYNTKDWKSKPSLTEEERYNLVDKHIYSYRYVDEIAEEKQSYISMSLNYFAPQEGYRQFSEKFVMGYFYFYIMVDRGIRYTPFGDRADLITARVYDIFQESRLFGIGELEMKTQGEIWLDKGMYGGYHLGFQIIEFK